MMVWSVSEFERMTNKAEHLDASKQKAQNLSGNRSCDGQADEQQPVSHGYVINGAAGGKVVNDRSSGRQSHEERAYTASAFVHVAVGQETEALIFLLIEMRVAKFIAAVTGAEKDAVQTSAQVEKVGIRCNDGHGIPREEECNELIR